MNWKIYFSVVMLIVVTGCASGPGIIKDLKCGALEGLSSRKGGNKVQLEFVNSQNSPVDVFWITYKGVEKKQGTIKPEEGWKVMTYEFHQWVVRDEEGDCIKAININPQLKIVI